MYTIDASPLLKFNHPVVVDGGILGVVKNALRRDAEAGRPVRGEMADAIDKYSAPLEISVKDGDEDYKAWYEEAMVASNEAGYVGLSAAETIRELYRELQAEKAEYDELARLSFDQPSDKETS